MALGTSEVAGKARNLSISKGIIPTNPYIKCLYLADFWHNVASQQVLDDIVNSEFGHRLYLTGIGTGVTELELHDFLLKYTEKKPSFLERVDLDTAFPAYVTGFHGLRDGEIQQFADRINGIYWHGHQIAAHVI